MSFSPAAVKAKTRRMILKLFKAWEANPTDPGSEHALRDAMLAIGCRSLLIDRPRDQDNYIILTSSGRIETFHSPLLIEDTTAWRGKGDLMKVLVPRQPANA